MAKNGAILNVAIGMRLMSSKQFGRLDDGRSIHAVTLRNKGGLEVVLLTLGASVQSFFVPDRNGERHDIVLGFDGPQEYLNYSGFMGATIGRYANRIANGRFSLGGRTIQLAQNEPPNHLHGGDEGFHTQVFELVSFDERSAEFSHISPAGHAGFPGQLNVTVRYTMLDDGVSIEFLATTDEPTIVNLTNHAYFNLAGVEGPSSILDHEVTLYADAFTPIGVGSIPSGEVRHVQGTNFDFRQPTQIAENVHRLSDEQIEMGSGFDHNWVLRKTRRDPELAATVVHAGSGRCLEVWTDQPGIQFYSGNCIGEDIIGKTGVKYSKHSGFCLEPQIFPDAPNHEGFPNAELMPGETYKHTMIYKCRIQSE